MDNSGNFWADADDPNGAPTLTYFAGCSGKGVKASGFAPFDYGSIDIDKSGNLVIIDGNNGNGTASVDVYSGCKPACKLLSSTPLIAYVIRGRLNRRDDNFVVGDFNNNQVDIYKYKPISFSLSALLGIVSAS
jgi:hypothetical protein